MRRGKWHEPAAGRGAASGTDRLWAATQQAVRTGCAPGTLEDRGRAPFPSSRSRMSEAKDSGSRGPSVDPRLVQTSMPSWTPMGQGWWAHARMIWPARSGVTASNPAVMARGAASVLAASLGAGLEVVGADLPTVGLGLEVVEQVPGLLRGFNR